MVCDVSSLILFFKLEENLYSQKDIPIVLFAYCVLLTVCCELIGSIICCLCRTFQIWVRYNQFCVKFWFNEINLYNLKGRGFAVLVFWFSTIFKFSNKCWICYFLKYKNASFCLKTEIPIVKTQSTKKMMTIL